MTHARDRKGVRLLPLGQMCEMKGLIRSRPGREQQVGIPRDLDSRTTITIDDQTFDIEADDLESICVLGRGAYGVVEKMRHKQTETILAVKVIELTLAQ